MYTHTLFLSPGLCILSETDFFPIGVVRIINTLKDLPMSRKKICNSECFLCP